MLPGLSTLLPSGPGGRGRGPRGQARPVYHTHSCLSVVPEPGRLGWKEGGTPGKAAGPAADAHPPDQAPQCPWTVGTEAASVTGVLPGQRHTSSSRCGEAPGRSRAPPPPTSGRTGQCRAVPPAQERLRWENSSSALFWASAGVGDAGPPSRHSPEPEGAQPAVALSPGEGPGGGGSPSPRRKTLGGEAPGGSRLRVAGQWLGWWRQEPRQAGPPLGAGPGWGHRKSQ